MLKLDNDDIKFLMEALDALESKSTHDVLFESIFEIGMSNDKESASKKMKDKMRAIEDSIEPLKERIIILKAKLIQMKDKNVVDQEVSRAIHDSP